MNTEMLEFLFAGPLFSINKELKQLRRQIVGLREDLTAYAQRLDTATTNIRADFTALEEKLANSPAAEDVSAEMAKLGESIGGVEGLDRPDIPPASPGEPPLEETVGGGGETPSETPPSEEQPQT